MATDDIQGRITDERGNAISGAVVYLWSDDNPNQVKRTTTDSSGNYLFEEHPDGDGTSQNWHIAAQYDDGGQQYNTVSQPYVSASLPSPSAIPDSGVTHYKFEQDLTDSWDGNDGTDNTSAGYSTTAQYGSYSKAFDGTDDDVDSGISEIGSSSGAYSIAFWLYHQGSTSSIERWAGNLNKTSDDIFIDNNQTNDIRIFDDAIGGGAVASGVLTTNTWLHVVAAVDSNGSEIYVDGSSQDTNTSGGRTSPSNSGTTFKLGQGGNDTYGQFLMDNFKYYDNRLSDSEVSNLYNNGSI